MPKKYAYFENAKIFRTQKPGNIQKSNHVAFFIQYLAQPIFKNIAKGTTDPRVEFWLPK